MVSSTCPGEPQGSVAGSGRWAGVRARHPRSSPMLSSARVSVSETGLVTEDPWVPRAPRGPGVANPFTDPSCRAAVSPRGLISPGGPRGKAGPAPHRRVSGPLWGRSGSFGAVRDRGWPRHVGHATGQGWGDGAGETRPGRRCCAAAPPTTAAPYLGLLVEAGQVPPQHELDAAVSVFLQRSPGQTGGGLAHARPGPCAAPSRPAWVLATSPSSLPVGASPAGTRTHRGAGLGDRPPWRGRAGRDRGQSTAQGPCGNLGGRAGAEGGWGSRMPPSLTWRAGRRGSSSQTAC